MGILFYFFNEEVSEICKVFILSGLYLFNMQGKCLNSISVFIYGHFYLHYIGLFLYALEFVYGVVLVFYVTLAFSLHWECRSLVVRHLKPKDEGIPTTSDFCSA